MTAPLPNEMFAEIIVRDVAAEDGLVVMDNYMALDRHLLIGEVQRLRLLVDRLRKGRPTADRKDAS